MRTQRKGVTLVVGAGGMTDIFLVEKVLWLSLPDTPESGVPSPASTASCIFILDTLHHLFFPFFLNRGAVQSRGKETIIVPGSRGGKGDPGSPAV